MLLTFYKVCTSCFDGMIDVAKSQTHDIRLADLLMKTDDFADSAAITWVVSLIKV